MDRTFVGFSFKILCMRVEYIFQTCINLCGVCTCGVCTCVNFEFGRGTYIASHLSFKFSMFMLRKLMDKAFVFSNISSFIDMILNFSPRNFSDIVF